MSPKLYHVFVEKTRTVRYTIQAENEEQAQAFVEASDDADDDFGFKTLDSTWSVTGVRLR